MEPTEARPLPLELSRVSSVSRRPSFPSSTSINADLAHAFSQTADDYLVESPIGYGSSAVVYAATYLPLQMRVAIKMIDLDMFERNQIDELRREIQIMAMSKHPNLLPIHCSFVHTHQLYIIAPFLSGGSCLDIMKTEGFEECVIASFLKQTLLGLEYLHKSGLVHRDIKAGNLLIADDGLLQLADFGVSNSLIDSGQRKGKRKTFVGTPCWMAPEVMEQTGYDYKADIWSLGITSLELSNGHAPYSKYPPMKVLMLTLQNDPPTLDRDNTKHKYTKLFKDMIDSCLQKDPAKRPSTEKLLQHSFFKSAKKNSYIVQTVLQSLPPITQRSHNRRPKQTKKEEQEPGVSWDFSDKDDLLETLVKFSLADESQSATPDLQESIPRKSRFVVDDKSAAPALDTPLFIPAQDLNASIETKKGRFTVNESALPPSQTPALPQALASANPVLSLPITLATEIVSAPAHLLAVNNDLNNQKPSRFTVTLDQSKQKTRPEDQGDIVPQSPFASPRGSVSRKTSVQSLASTSISLEERLDHLARKVDGQARTIVELQERIVKLESTRVK